MVIPGLGIPVRTVFCIGRNYAEHIKEMGSSATETPVVFQKPLSAIAWEPERLVLPKQSRKIHHEVEVVLAIGQTASRVQESSALELIAGYAIGIDVTARDLQEVAKAKGLPWTLCKGLPGFAPIGNFVAPSFPVAFSLTVNDTTRQQGLTDSMLFSVPRILAYLAETFTLNLGDLIFTGTPPGVGALVSGDRVSAELGNGASRLNFSVVGPL